MADISIISSTPANGAAGVLLDTYIELYTSAQLKPQTVTSGNVSIRDVGNTLLSGTLTYSNHNNGVYGVIGFSPDAPLKALQTYTITIVGLVGIADEEQASSILITFTAGEILTKTLTTADNITFFEKLCYPQDGSNIAGWTEYEGEGILQSRHLEKVVAGMTYPITVTILTGSGTVSNLGIKYYRAGASATYTWQKQGGGEAFKVYIDGVLDENARQNNEYVFKNILSGHSIAIAFYD